MPTFQPTPDLTMHYEVDDFTDPWREPETVLLFPAMPKAAPPGTAGFLVLRAVTASCGRHAWLWRVDGDAARFPVDPRPADRGFRRADGPAWQPPIPSCRRQDRRDDRPRICGAPARAGDELHRGRHAAADARRPRRARSRAGRRIPDPGRSMGRAGRGRLGSDFPPEGVEWWIKFMGRTAVSTQIGFMKTIACADIRADVPQIRCPTLVITTDDSGLASVDQTRAWQQLDRPRVCSCCRATPTMSRRAMPRAAARRRSTSSNTTRAPREGGTGALAFVIRKRT